MTYYLLEKSVIGFINLKDLRKGRVVTGHVRRKPVEIHVDGKQAVHINDVHRIGPEGSTVFDPRLSPWPFRRIAFMDDEESQRFNAGLTYESIRGMQLTLGRAWEKAGTQFKAGSENKG